MHSEYACVEYESQPFTTCTLHKCRILCKRRLLTTKVGNTAGHTFGQFAQLGMQLSDLIMCCCVRTWLIS